MIGLKALLEEFPALWSAYNNIIIIHLFRHFCIDKSDTVIYPRRVMNTFLDGKIAVFTFVLGIILRTWIQFIIHGSVLCKGGQFHTLNCFSSAPLLNTPSVPLICSVIRYCFPVSSFVPCI